MKEKLIEENGIGYSNGKWNLFIRDIENESVIFNVIKDGKQIITITLGQGWVTVVILFSGNEQPIVLKGEMEITDTLIIRNTQNRIALYVGDTLWDEDWPIGEVLLKDAICVTCAASVEINDDDLAGIKNAEFSILNTFRNAQNWKPRGYNTRVGDCMPFFHDGEFRLFYLFDRRAHKSKWGLGAHQWAQISSKNLIHWDEHPLAITIDEQYEGSICTGSVIYHDGLYYAFYAVRMSDGSPAKLTWSTSSDGVHFKKTGRVFALVAPYHGPSARDQKVFCDESGKFHMLVTTSLINTDGEETYGCLAHLQSDDLEEWTQLEPFITLDSKEQPECSDYFYWNGWYYLVYSNFAFATYHISRNPFGPWQSPEDNIIVDKNYRVPKRDFWTGNRVLFVGFRSIDNSWGGRAVFYEAMQNSDGTLSFAFPKEMES